MKEATLKKYIVDDLKERGTYHTVDGHLVDEYVGLVMLAKQLRENIAERGIFYHDERDVERTNPAIRTLNATESSINSLAKLLGIGPYARKLTTGGTSKNEKKKDVAAALLRPISGKKNKAK